ncbi:hypothetical protein AB0C11_22130 [Streptomyces sp. NPDC039016]|uniref:hypothetical protein n=1 Tax=Streptomyces sp. NPDC039016 TaxID=3154330 RepID=UPI0033D3FED1
MTTTDHPDPAEPAPARSSSGAPKVAARKGVLSALRPNPHPTTHRPPEQLLFGLYIIAPPQWNAVTRATAICRCGTYDREARGRAAVLRLVEDWDHHRTTTCPLLAPQEGRATA